MKILLTLFVILPIVEMWLLIMVGSHLGALITIALVLLTAMIGVALLRQQGLATLMKARHKLSTGSMPLSEMVAGLCLAVGGALLLTPGFLTDALGFCCLLPGLRQGLCRWALHHLQANLQTAHSAAEPPPGTPSQSRPRSQASGVTLEGEYEKDERA